MPRLFAAEQETVLAHATGDVVIPDVRAHERDPHLCERLFRAEIGEDGAHDGAAGQGAFLQSVGRKDEEDLVAVDDIPFFVAGDDAVGVAVKGETEVGAEAHRLLRDDFGVQSAASVVDVLSVRG